MAIDRIKQRIKEDEMMEEMDNHRLYEAWLPIIKRLGMPGQCDTRDMSQKLGQLGLCVVAELAIAGKSERVRATCGKELAYMGGLKPIDRSVGVDVHVMAEAEVDALLKSKMSELRVLSDGPVEFLEGELIDEARGCNIQGPEGALVTAKEGDTKTSSREGKDT